MRRAAILAMTMVFGGVTAASADQLTLVCHSTVQRILSNGSTGYTDPFKVYVDTTAQTEREGDDTAPAPATIDNEAIATHSQVTSSHGFYRRIDRTTGEYEVRLCDDDQCRLPPPSWTVTDKGQCEKGTQKF